MRRYYYFFLIDMISPNVVGCALGWSNQLFLNNHDNVTCSSVAPRKENVTREFKGLSNRHDFFYKLLTL